MSCISVYPSREKRGKKKETGKKNNKKGKNKKKGKQNYYQRNQTAEDRRKTFIAHNITQTLSWKLNPYSSDIVTETEARKMSSQVVSLKKDIQ